MNSSISHLADRMAKSLPKQPVRTQPAVMRVILS